MPIRTEKDITVCGTEYRVRQLPGTTGARILLKILKVFFNGAESFADLLENTHVKEIIETFFTTSLVINDIVFEDLPASVKQKLKSVSGQTFPDVESLHEGLKPLLSEVELEKYYLQISRKAAFTSTPEFSQILSMTGHVLTLLKDIIHRIDEDDLDDLLTGLINNSVIRYTPASEEKTTKWLNAENNYAFDNQFAGNYNEMLELFVYLVLFNYAESFIMLKKNQILEWLKPWLDKLKPTPEQETPQ